MIVTAPSIENLTFTVSQEIHIRSSLEATFAAILEEMGPSNVNPNGDPLVMKLEPWPGGRWYRDLGSDNGHFWGHVQAIKRPTLIEICGPLFMSQPVINNIQYRLKVVDGGTLLTFTHSAFGAVSEEHRKGVVGGWEPLNERIRKHAEAA